jgi:site-specific recombinase XerD
MTALELVLVTDPLPTVERELARDPALSSANTRRTYRGALADFEAWRDGRPITKLTLEEYASELQARGLAPATINHKLAAVRWWARRLADLAAESAELEPARRAELVRQAERAATVGGVKGDNELKGRHVSDAQIRALLQACADDPSPIGWRDAAMLALAFATGMRRSEVAAITLADLAPLEDGYEVTVRRAKGNRIRKVAVYNGAADWLRDWLALRGDAPGPVFLAVRKGGELLDHGIGGQAMQERLARRAQEAGVAALGWHDARRTLAGNLLDAGHDLATVARILGHASTDTTAKYDRRPEETRRAALRGLHVPYWARS